jgi:putative ABC transport system permease protein
MNLLTEFKEGLAISWGAIRANKMRSALTTLGIVIGIITVTLMGTAIDGLNRAFIKSISFIGADVLYVQRHGWFIDTHEEYMRMQKRRPITLTQVRALEKHLTLARAISPMTGSQQPVQFGKRRSDAVTVIGTTEQFIFTSSIGIAEGRFFSASEVSGARPVCVIGCDVATNLFQRGSPLGQKISIGPMKYEVIGVMEKQGTFLGMFSLDNQAIIPIQQFISNFASRPEFDIQIRVRDITQLEAARDEVRGAMRMIRRLAPADPDDFAINQQEQMISMFHKIAGTIAAVGLFITGLSLFVGGIGIMNIMFVSVAERTREIGIRKALGAKRRTIMIQFLIEAAGICLLGGLIALSLALPITLLMQKFLPATLSVTVIGIALGVSLATGVAAGFFPAWRAACMNPVDALRNE